MTNMRMLAYLPLLLITVEGCAPLGRLSPLRPLEKSLVYQPAKFPIGEWERPDLKVENVDFESLDGTPLHGWFLDHPAPQAIALFMHGNGGNVSLCGDSMKILHDRNRLAIMSFDYRGYGKSKGKPSEEGILDDARAARRWLALRKQVPETSIVLMGQSLGGGVALDLAAKDGARGLVVASTFTSLPDVAQEILPWMLPRWNMTQRLNSLDKIGRYHGPILIAHGDADKTIPFEHGKRLFEAANEPKRFVVIPGGDHNDPMPESYRLELDTFLAHL